MFVTVWEIYGEAFRDVLPEPEPLSSTGPLPPVAPSGQGVDADSPTDRERDER
jgi:hypothetical protein